MPPVTFDQIDGYVEDLFHLHDPVLQAALADARAAGLPAIEVSPVQGRLLTVLGQARAVSGGAHPPAPIQPVRPSRKARSVMRYFSPWRRACR